MIKKLIDAATFAMDNAYAPYSNFKVGAAAITKDDKIITGCNIENSSYGLSICAERIALFKAISDGHKKFKALAITAETSEVIKPCGACRQIIAEFCEPNMPIYLLSTNGKLSESNIDTLLPMSFNGGDVENAR